MAEIRFGIAYVPLQLGNQSSGHVLQLKVGVGSSWKETASAPAGVGRGAQEHSPPHPGTPVLPPPLLCPPQLHPPLPGWEGPGRGCLFLWPELGSLGGVWKGIRVRAQPAQKVGPAPAACGVPTGHLPWGTGLRSRPGCWEQEACALRGSC